MQDKAAAGVIVDTDGAFGSSVSSSNKRDASLGSSVATLASPLPQQHSHKDADRVDDDGGGSASAAGEGRATASPVT